MDRGDGSKWARDKAIVRYWFPRWGLPVSAFCYARTVFNHGPFSVGKAVYLTVANLILGVAVSYCLGLYHDRTAR
jgi:hypothetical protein